ncbi:uncharacterized protein BDZ99DRAFT_517205 [Mytilinidion resinicola]|uniref:Uncharacterized protein n=1 Tax=Mytilinidion resinicola TaxID=574789 RepID=A0A6A6YVD7_9PEZI|nr:uncharacterized protein BDZ99DRAFT_517205 [Mytilinidion resinicola]KAF2812902.1 hypothetical protein BDZ99DRAFT_517205 [Mytilinidion resinicola]
MVKALKYRNILTKTLRNQSHHCHECKGTIKESCLNVHVSYCTADGCGEIYNGKPGCFVHKYVDGYNADFFEKFTGKKPNTAKITTGFGMRQEPEPEQAPVEDENWNQASKPKRKVYRRKPRKDGNEDGEDQKGEEAGKNGQNGLKQAGGKKGGN